MKRADVIDLIRFHTEENDIAFNNVALKIAQDFESSGETQLAGYIMNLISRTRVFIPQDVQIEGEYEFLQKMIVANFPLSLPDDIAKDIQGLLHALSRNMQINTVLFYGAPGTGKTEGVKQVARLLGRPLYIVNFNQVIDSRLGETGKNISRVFHEISQLENEPIVLFDEIDALALDRVNANDVREMGRATSALLREFDAMDGRVTIIATTNLHDRLDKALLRRFDARINFDRYTRSDLVEIGITIADSYTKAQAFVKNDARTLRKILTSCPTLPNPGELKNMIKSSIAFSDPSNPNDYLVKIFTQLNPGKQLSPSELQAQGFTLREMEVLTGIPKSTLARQLKE